MCSWVTVITVTTYGIKLYLVYNGVIWYNGIDDIKLLYHMCIIPNVKQKLIHN